MSRLHICDTTLRDGEQAPGVAFSAEEKTEIAIMLDSAGVEQAEIGIPAMGEAECRSIARIAALGLQMKLMTWNRAVFTDIDAAESTGVGWAHISVPVSTVQMKAKLGMNPEQVTELIRKSVDYGLCKGLTVSVGFEDASRADDLFLEQLANQLYRDGIRRFRYADTLSVHHPAAIAARIERFVSRVPQDVELEIHCHNDYGLALANTLAALQAGAVWASTTVSGLGERAGNTALEEVVMSWRDLYQGTCSVRPELLNPLAALVSKASNRIIPEGKPIVGDMVFAHESGIHINGLLKERAAYQALDPTELGADHSFVLGKHLGRSAVQYMLEQEGIEAGSGEIKFLLERLRLVGEDPKRVIHSADLRRWLQYYPAELPK
ncbi:homocysteine methyltransferase [Paenibacillus peoriae]|uniref:homocitrate synthase/isopropylmalate synthase family protein n=1 Tax=Paenibacillus peoriae TaxID=59893 RepID=UPI0006A7555C|nr:homocysteine methyltransferase [Paenibacillus peoriae]ALA40945.1 homocysteine methyltransferase [Paenibacillus peoriae]